MSYLSAPLHDAPDAQVRCVLVYFCQHYTYLTITIHGTVQQPAAHSVTYKTMLLPSPGPCGRRPARLNAGDSPAFLPPKPDGSLSISTPSQKCGSGSGLVQFVYDFTRRSRVNTAARNLQRGIVPRPGFRICIKNNSLTFAWHGGRECRS